MRNDSIMNYNPDIHHRRSIRLKDYDYSHAGTYFVTVCANNRELLFGRIREGNIILSDAGKMVSNVWLEIPDNYPGVDID